MSHGLHLGLYETSAFFGRSGESSHHKLHEFIFVFFRFATITSQL
jgi:hypothetical protein